MKSNEQSNVIYVNFHPHHDEEIEFLYELLEDRKEQISELEFEIDAIKAQIKYLINH